MANYQDEYIFKAEARVEDAISQIDRWLSMLDQARARAGQPFPTQIVLGPQGQGTWEDIYNNIEGRGRYPTSDEVRASAQYQAQVNQVFRDGVETRRTWLDVQKLVGENEKEYTKTVGSTTQYMNRLGQVTKEVRQDFIDLADGYRRVQEFGNVFQENLAGQPFTQFPISEEFSQKTRIRKQTLVTGQERFTETGQLAAPLITKREEVFTQQPNRIFRALGISDEKEIGRLTTEYERLDNGLMTTRTHLDGMTKSVDGVSNRMVRHMRIIAEAIIAYEGFRLAGQVVTEWAQAHSEMDWAITQFSINVDASTQRLNTYLETVGKLAYATGTARPEVFETAALATRLERPELARPATEIEMMWGTQSTSAVRDLFAIQQQFPNRQLDEIMNTLIRNVRAGSLSGGEVLDISETWGAFSKQFALDLEEISSLFVGLGTILGETGNPLETFMRHLERFYTDPKLAALTEQYTGVPTTTKSTLTGEEIRRPMLEILQDIATMTTPAQQIEISQFMPQELGQKSRQFFNTMLAQWEEMDRIMAKATDSAYTWAEAVAAVSDTMQTAANRVKVAWQNALASFGDTDIIKKLLNDIAAGLEAVATRNAQRNQMNWVDRPTERERVQASTYWQRQARQDEVDDPLRESLALMFRQRGSSPGIALAEAEAQRTRIANATYGGTIIGPPGMDTAQWEKYRTELAKGFLKSPEFDWSKSGEELGRAFAEYMFQHGPGIAEGILGTPYGLSQYGYGTWASTASREAGVAPPPTPRYRPEDIPGTPQWQWVNPASRGQVGPQEIAWPLQTILTQITNSQEAARRTGQVFDVAEAQGIKLPEKMVTAYEQLTTQLQKARDAVSAIDPDKPAQANRLLQEAANRTNEVMKLASQVSEMQRDFVAKQEPAQDIMTAAGVTAMGTRMAPMEEGGQSLDMTEIQSSLDWAGSIITGVATMMEDAAIKFDYAASKTTVPQEIIDAYGGEEEAIAAIIDEYNRLNDEIQASAEAHGVARQSQQDATVFVDEFGRVIGTDVVALDVMAIAVGNVADASAAAAAGLLGLASVTIPEGLGLFEWSQYYSGAVKDIEAAAQRAGMPTKLEPEETLFTTGKGDILGTGQVDPNAARIAGQRASEDLRIQKEQLSQADRLAKEAQSEADRRHKEAIGVMQGIIAAIPGVTSPTPVTGADLFWRSVTGTYEDKFDEPVRRARAEVNNIIKGRPHEYELPGDLFTPELLGFAKGQETEQKTAILQDTLAEYERQFYGGMRPPEEYDKDTFIANAMKVIEEKQAAKQTQAMYMNWLEEAGLGPDSKMILGLMDEAPLVTALTGGKAPAEVQQQLAEYVALDSEQIQTSGVTNAFADTFKDFNWVAIIDSSIRTSIDNDKETLVTVGKVLGMVLADGASAGFVSHIVALIWAKLAKEMTQ